MRAMLFNELQMATQPPYTPSTWIVFTAAGRQALALSKTAQHSVNHIVLLSILLNIE